MLGKLSDAGLGFFFPPKCALCLTLGEEPLCGACAKEFVPMASGGFGVAGEGISWVDCCFLYDGRQAQAVKRLKFDRATGLYSWMARHMRERYDHAGGDLLFDVVTPVPLAKFRMSHRGFNQSALLASGLPNLELEALKRVRETSPQVGSTRVERLANLKDAFSATDVKGKRVLVIDDVYTTGATATACASALLKAGAESVGCLCFCYDPLPGFTGQA